jgi:hypothetical protein
MQRIVTVLTLALAISFSVPEPALAGQYEVHGCRTPGGAALPAVGWLGAYWHGHWFSSDDTCAQGGHLTAALMRVDTYEHLQGATSRWRFEAPPGLSVRRVRGDVAMRTSPSRPYASPVAWAQADDGQGRFGVDSGGARGSLEHPAAPGNHFDTGTMTPTAAYQLVAGCSGGGGSCPVPPLSEPAVAIVRVFRAQVTIEDLSAPTLTAPASGRLAEPGVHSGVEGVTVGAADRGSGVRRMVLELDGTERGAVVFDRNSGQCEDLLPLSAGPDYAVPVPCPPDVSGSVELDTRLLPEGEHRMRLLVEDAAGNRRVAAGPVSPWIVDNVAGPVVETPPAPDPAPAGPAPGSAGSATTGSGLAAAAQAVRARVELWFVTVSHRRVCERTIAGRSVCRRLPVRFTKRRGAALTQRYGRGLQLGGRVEQLDGSPVSGAHIVVRRLARGAPRWSERTAARSDRDGRFSLRLGRAAGERIQVAWTPAGAPGPVTSRTLTRRVRAGLALSVRGGWPPALRGILHGGARPGVGVPVRAEAWTRAGWSVFAETRIRPRQRAFSLPLSLPRGSWRVRLRALAAPGWPYEEGTSRSLRLRVR